MEESNSFKYKIYYSDTDAGGVLYYARYFEFLERARTDFLEQSGVKSKTLHNNQIFFAVRKVEADYLKPAFYGDDLIIEIYVTNLKRTNFTLRYKIYVKDQMIFSATTLLVCVDSNLNILKIPEEIYNFLKGFLKND